MIQVDPKGGPIVHAIVSEFIFTRYFGGKISDTHRGKVIVLIDSNPGVLEVTVVIEIPTPITRTGRKNTLSYRSLSEITSSVLDIQPILFAPIVTAHFELILSLGALVNLSDVSDVVPGARGLISIRQAPINGHVHSDRRVTEVNRLIILRMSRWDGQVPLGGEVVLEHVHLVVGDRPVEKEHFPDFPGSPLLEASRTVMTGAEGQ